MAVMVAVAARMLVGTVTVIIIHEFYGWVSNKLRSRLAYSRLPDREIFEETTTTAAAAVATPKAAEQIQFEEDRAFIKGEFSSALDPIATANAAAGGGVSNIDSWIKNIDPQVLARLRRVAGRIGWAVVDSTVEGSLPRGSRGKYNYIHSHILDLIKYYFLFSFIIIIIII